MRRTTTPDSIAEFNEEAYLNMELLRFTTAGSVDDGKSTLIGRLLYDSKAIFQDQMDQLEQASTLRGEKEVNLALLTDGLRAEREQGITIDVAYRYFSTPKRKFIIADTPGHEQYTRNMVTGASTADLAIILIDARLGVLPQSRRHGIIASLLGIPHVIVAVNKMDLVDYSKETYDAIAGEYKAFSRKLSIHDITFIPISALAGDNVVKSGENMPWYDGPTIMYQLEHASIAADRNLVDFRFPVQYVIRPHLDFRGFAGRIASGTIATGEPVTVLPSHKTSRIKEIVTFDGNREEAFQGESVTLTLEDEIDISRGDMIVRSKNIPEVTTRFQATLCWMDDDRSLSRETAYLLQCGTRLVKAFVRNLDYRLDINTLHRQEAATLRLNEIGRVEIESAMPLPLDPYVHNRETGSFILIDPASNQTVAGGMVRKTLKNAPAPELLNHSSNSVRWEKLNVTREHREARQGHRAHCLWFTGLSGSGKSTIAKAVEKLLFEEGKRVYMLDGDNIRHGLNGDLGFSADDRIENIRRIGEVARLLYDSGCIVLCTFISPMKAMRRLVKGLFPAGSFTEVYVKADLETCKSRDPKGLYTKAMAGEIPDFTGISSPYEEPESADLVLDTQTDTEKECVEKAVACLKAVL
jgi:bifunctional enzyme CysN/CysC